MQRLKSWLLVITLLCLPFPSPAAEKRPPFDVALDPEKPGPGDIVVATVKNKDTAGPPEGTFNGKKVHFFPSKDSFKAVIGIDLYMAPGAYPLEISTSGASLERRVKVVKKEYPIQRLTLPKDMVELSAENEARVERERLAMAAIWPNEGPRAWNGNFLNPLDGEIVTQFGVRRIINKIPKSSHSGMDVSGDEGDPVRAPGSGVAVLTDEQFYSGKSVVLDHGEGIYTMFFHLSRVMVASGQEVKKGDVIGLVGSTGRSTGPHLHWGVRIQGARVNPQELIKLRLE